MLKRLHALGYKLSWHGFQGPWMNAEDVLAGQGVAIAPGALAVFIFPRREHTCIAPPPPPQAKSSTRDPTCTASRRGKWSCNRDIYV